MPRNVIQLAIKFNRCPIAWKVVADKAFVAERGADATCPFGENSMRGNMRYRLIKSVA